MRSPLRQIESHWGCNKDNAMGMRNDGSTLLRLKKLISSLLHHALLDGIALDMAVAALNLPLVLLEPNKVGAPGELTWGLDEGGDSYRETDGGPEATKIDVLEKLENRVPNSWRWVSSAISSLRAISNVERGERWRSCLRKDLNSGRNHIRNWNMWSWSRTRCCSTEQEQATQVE